MEQKTSFQSRLRVCIQRLKDGGTRMLQSCGRRVNGAVVGAVRRFSRGADRSEIDDARPGPMPRALRLFLALPWMFGRGLIRAVVAVMRWIWRVLNGIQFRLAVFTGSLIAGTIVILSTSYVHQQTEILRESYEREAAISRNYISSLVLELDNISQSLIRVEEFRLRVGEQTQALKKYQTVTTTVTVTEKKKETSFLGIKSNWFGLAGTEKIEEKQTKTSDNYFSTYLSNNDTQVLEKNVLLLLQQSGGTISDRAFSALQAQAKKLVLAERELDALKDRLAQRQQREGMLAEQKPEGDPARVKAAAETQAAEERMREQSIQTRKLRSELDASVISHLLEARKRKIQELGLDTGRFRIQTFSALGLQPGLTPEAAVDTRIFDPASALNQLDVSQSMEESLQHAFAAIRQNGVLGELKPVALRMDGLELQALYSPYFEHPASTERARLLEQQRPKLKPRFTEQGEEIPPWAWAAYAEEEKPILAQLAKITPVLRARLRALRETNPPTPPFEDAAFRAQYDRYAKLVQQRNALYEGYLKNHPPSEEDRQSVEALGYLRDAALEDQLLVRFRTDGADHARSVQSPEDRAKTLRRWQALRQWIYSGQSETPTPQLKTLFSDGLIGNSRTEAEEVLWKLDTTPLYSDTGKDLPQVVLGQNFAGMTRTIVDRTDGLRAIQSNRDKAVEMALLIFGAAVLLAVAISYIAVRKIKRLIRNAEKVGQGDLEVAFPTKGADEFGSLSRALNRMVGGLREREKIKGILGNMIDPVVVGEAMKDMAALKRGSELRVTAFFSDVAGFSGISEKLSSVELANLLNEYLSAMTLILKEHEGVLDKYIGDAIVGIFNAPVPVEDHSLKAVRASLKMLRKLEDLRLLWKRENRYMPEVHDMRIRIGLNVGLAKVGFMGTDALASYTMMGDTVNLAARLEAAGKDYGVSLLISDAVYAEVKDHVFSRKLDLVRVKGKSEPVVLYEAIAEWSELEQAELGSEVRKRQAAACLYGEGLDLYLARKWDAAIAKFKDSEQARGEADLAVRQLVERCLEYKQNPPPPDWDGVYTREHK